MVLGISARDRPGLLHDISQGLNRLQVQLLHCEAGALPRPLLGSTGADYVTKPPQLGST
jgi:hypothetical protein